MGNALLFPARDSSYSVKDIEGLFWVPESLGSDEGKNISNVEELEAFYARPNVWIPCQYLPASHEPGAAFCILYLHGNSCDLGDMVEEMTLINDQTGMNVVHMEYPGYGICKDAITKPETIDLWAQAVARMLIVCGVDPKCLIIMGRSIGTGPAAALAEWVCSNYKGCGPLVLHSPYISIHSIVKDYAWGATYLISDSWNTAERLRYLGEHDVPLVISHGETDEVIGVQHGRELYDNYTGSPKIGVFSKTSKHNSYEVLEDIIFPIRELLSMIDYRPAKPTPRSLVPNWAETMRVEHVPPPDDDVTTQLPVITNPVARLLFCGCGNPYSPGSPNSI